MELQDENSIIARYGRPVRFNGGHTALNESSIAWLFAKSGCYRNTALRGIEEYDTPTGLWIVIHPSVLSRRITDFIFDFGKDPISREAIGFKLKGHTLAEIIRRFEENVTVSQAEIAPVKKMIHTANCVLLYSPEERKMLPRPFDPKYNSINRIPFNYNPDAKCPKFIEKLVKPMLSDPDSLIYLQLYFGQILLKQNISQTILLLSGPAGIGKSVLVNVIELLLGREENVCELHLDQLNDKFELVSCYGKSLLTAKDVADDALSDKHISILKKMTGNDTMTAEQKYQAERISITGEFNIIITGNSDITLNYGSNRGAWERRILWIPCKTPEHIEKVEHFDELLIKEEAEGILAWAVEGAVKLLNAGGIITRSESQSELCGYLLDESVPVTTFVKRCIRQKLDSAIVTEDAYTAFQHYVTIMRWNNVSMTEDKFAKEFKQQMARIHPACRRSNDIVNQETGKKVRGYVNCQIVLPELTAKKMASVV